MTRKRTPIFRFGSFCALLVLIGFVHAKEPMNRPGFSGDPFV